MVSSLILGPFDLLDPLSPVYLLTGWERGAPAPSVAEIVSTVLDGAAVTGRASGNRQMSIPIRVEADTRLGMATLANQVLQTVDQPSWQLTWTPDGGLPVVFDCYRATSGITSGGVLEADGAQTLSVQCEALPYGRSTSPQTFTLAGSSVQIEGFNATPEPVTVAATVGTVTATSRATSPVYEGAGALQVDYVSGAVSFTASNSAPLSIAIMNAISVVTVRVRVPAAASISATGNWVFTLNTDVGLFISFQSSGYLPGNNVYAPVSFDLSAVPVGATITDWWLQTPVVSQVAASPTTSQTFAYTGARVSWTVPAGVYSVKLDGKGAGGGGGPVNAGKGERLIGTLAVTPGDVLSIGAGGGGLLYSTASPGTARAGGFNGGGAGGTSSNGYAGSSGGGATDVRVGGTALANRVFVAAGGGGGGRGYSSKGGAGGTTTGENGDSGYDFAGGGTQTAGGVRGSVPPGVADNATNGALGVGGIGSQHSSSGFYAGGGGGGGYYGGAGGHGDTGSNSSGGGGGGSRYVSPAVTAITDTRGGGGTGGLTGATRGDHGSLTISYSTTDKMFLDDLRAYPFAAAGVSDAYGGTYLLSGILGTARTPISVAVTKSGGGTFAPWVVHTPPADRPTAQPLIPLAGAASGANYTTDPTVRYDGTYSVWLAGGTVSGAGGRTWTVTVTQSLPAGGPNAVVSTVFTATPASNRMVKLGEVTLPLTGYPPETSVTTTVTVTSTVAADTFLGVLLLDTRGQSVIVDSTATARAAGWIDTPDPTVTFGGVWTGADRTTATSVASKLAAADLLIQDPGDSQVLLYSPAGALAGTVTYYPRWLQEATS